MRCALALATVAFAWRAEAQFSRLADEIEWKRLDLRPSPTWVRAPGVQVYGRLDLAASRSGGRYSIGQAAVPSFVGVRGDQPVGAGWRVRFEFEQGFDASSEPAEPSRSTPSTPSAPDCGEWFDRACWLQLEHASGASLLAGRYLQPAYRIAAMADPWLGAAGATAPPLRYAAPLAANSTSRIRSSQAMALRSPLWDGHRVELMRTLAGQSPDEVGVAWWFERGAWLLGAGWQRWDKRNDALPVAAVLQLGWWRMHLGATLGHEDDLRYRGAVLGLTFDQRQGARPWRWRVSVAGGRSEGQPSQSKLALGVEQARGPRVSLYGNAAWSRQPTPSGWSLEIGIRQEFSK